MGKTPRGKNFELSPFFFFGRKNSQRNGSIVVRRLQLMVSLIGQQFRRDDIGGLVSRKFWEEL